MDKKVVYLTGFMGSGKSTIGPILANTLGWDFYDLDKIIENKTGISIKDIFETFGEDHFRNLERESLSNISNQNQIIVSLGGGTIANNQNIELLKRTGIIVYLKLSSTSVYKRLENKRDRPVLFSDLGDEFTKEDLLKRIEELLEKRRMFYEQADFIIDTDNVSVGKTIDNIAKIIQNELEKKNEKN
ncbi:MAG: shikimate kinase [Ignavibacteriaceae bacterium]|nr:shikimate kinase [Ignavibacteriaceae bacterium]